MTWKREEAEVRYYRTRIWVGELKMEKGCAHCGYAEHPAALHFHHRNPEEKCGSVTKLLTGAKQKLLDEIAKCDVLCANCHAKVTWKETHD